MKTFSGKKDNKYQVGNRKRTVAQKLSGKRSGSKREMLQPLGEIQIIANPTLALGIGQTTRPNNHTVGGQTNQGREEALGSSSTAKGFHPASSD